MIRVTLKRKCNKGKMTPYEKALQRAYDAENQAERVGLENVSMREAIKDAYEYMCQWQIAKAKVTLFKWAVLK